MTSMRFGATYAAVAALVLAAVCQGIPVSAEPAVKYMDVNDGKLPYVEEGEGPTVVFLHGAAADYRAWDRQRSMLAKEGYRAVSYTLRYFGAEPWEKNWPVFSGKTHAEDLAAFIRGISAGPVNVATWSYSGHVALTVAVENPELINSLFIYEPSAPTYVTEPSVLQAIRDDGAKTFGAAVKAVKENDAAEAVRQLINGVSGEGSGYFATQPADVQARELDSAPGVLQMFKAPPPVSISCTQLGSIKVPTAVVWGADTRPYFRLIAEEAARCIPAGKHITIPGATHLWPGAQPERFVSTLVSFLRSH